MKRLRRAGRALLDLLVTAAVYLRLVRPVRLTSSSLVPLA
jgi:hypothetical protein